MALFRRSRRSKKSRIREAQMEVPTSLSAFAQMSDAEQAVMAQALLNSTVEHRWLKRAS